MRLEYLTDGEQLLRSVIAASPYGAGLGFALLVSPLFNCYFVYRLLRMRDAEAFMPGRIRMALFLTVSYILPALFWATAAFVYFPAYRQEKGSDITPYLEIGYAGLLTVPSLLFASVYLMRAVLKGRVSRFAWVLQSYVAILALWMAYLIGFERYVKEEMGNLQIGALWPLMFFVVHLLVLLRLFPRLETPKRNGYRSEIAIGLFSGALVIEWIYKFKFARWLLERAPRDMPDGYGGDCFVVSACVNGHGEVVRSFRDHKTGRLLNAQLWELREFERHIETMYPKIHTRFRRSYNKIGPRLASRIRFRIVADAIYLLLKPLELVARLCNQLLFR